MDGEFVTVYGADGALLAVLENAGEISYVLTHNDLWTGSFSLPADDPKNAFCEAHNLVKLPDGTRDLGLYRIVSMPTSEDGVTGGVKTYSVEHVMATLLDDVLFGYHEIGGEGVTTKDVAEYILGFQTVKRWVLGTCEFSDEYAYKFENTSVLASLLSLSNVLLDEYTWDFDTSTGDGTEAHPWTVNLRKADASAGCGITYMRNMVGIEKSMDASTLVTRLYLLGYGEGVNQLTVKDVNGGLPYIDADTIGKWGVKCSVYADTRLEDAATLLASGKAVLEKYKNPYISYTASAIDLARLTGHSWDEYMPGKNVHVMDSEHGIDFTARIVTVSKSDVGGRPGEIAITIANAEKDAADSMNTLADRVGISELYSQGATNLYAQQFADNADATHPAVMRVYVPSGCVRINQMLLSWSTAKFRAYETGAAAGGGKQTTTASGGSSSTTSEEGGSAERTSESGGEYAATVAETTVSSAAATGTPLDSEGYDMSKTTYAKDSSGEAMSNTSGGSGNTGDSSITNTGSAGAAIDTGSAGEHSHTIGSHVHTGPSHRHSFSATDTLANGHYHTVTVKSLNTATSTGGVSANSSHEVSISGNTGYAGSGSTSSTQPTCSEDGAHTHKLGSHYHGVNHTHTAGTHTHGMAHYHGMNHWHKVTVAVTVPSQKITIPGHAHTFTMPSHTHTVKIPSHTHDVTLDDHTHAIVYGIYEGTRASNITVIVDDTAVPAEDVKSSEMDIAKYLEKDEDGKITRGTWHEIQLVPDKLTRIEANLFVQTFVQSVGGGDY